MCVEKNALKKKSIKATYFNQIYLIHNTWPVKYVTHIYTFEYCAKLREQQ